MNKLKSIDQQKETMSKKTKARWDNPEERQKMITVRKKFGNTLEFKEKISKISIERWEDPKFKQKMSKISPIL
jgi:hypothetical protein